MGIINIVKNIKTIHNNDIAIIKIGQFYHVYGKDSYIISYLFDYKLNEIESIKTCGFPEKSINKVIAKLEENKINYMVIDRRNNYKVDLVSNNKNLNKYDKYYYKAKEYINIRSRIEKIYKFMLDDINKQDIKIIIKQMEELINERRKIQSN